jgi:uncharacterized phage protein (TIGR02220 family)
VGEILSLDTLIKLEHFSRNVFRVNKTYVDIVGDLTAGLLLGQIVYWHLPNENGKSKLKVVKKDGLWLAKGREEWWNEIRITPKQYDRAIKILKDQDIVNVKLYRFSGVPKIHIQLNHSVLANRVNSILPKGESPFLPKGEMDITERDKSLTEITTKTTTKITTKEHYVEIVNYLNSIAGTSYKSSSKRTRSLINARLNEGFTVKDFKTVIKNKSDDWLKDKKMNKYLRPETLFGTKFESYLNERGERNAEIEYDLSHKDITKATDEELPF